LADAVRLSMKEQMSLNNSKHRSAVDPDEAWSWIIREAPLREDSHSMDSDPSYKLVPN
jgi:hypothetical protein